MTERNSWDAAAQARVSDRWTTASAEWNTAMTDALLAAATLSPDSVVLDLAAGSGDPALTIAERLVAGGVIALDSSRTGLLLADTRARHLGLDSKIRCLQADAHAIPLAPNCVDRITCRCGVMFFNNTRLVMSEMMRVLKPEGRVACLAWGSFEQPFFESTIALVLRLVRGAEMSAQARTMFRFASPGSLKRELRAAGFSNVNEESIIVPRIWTGSPQELWAYLQEVSTLCHPLFEGIPEAMRAKVDTEVSSGLARFRSGNVLRVPASLIVASGHRDVASALAPEAVGR
jgi:ubiquinone/menaquinone biosynthesis C-methylase UbiE